MYRTVVRSTNYDVIVFLILLFFSFSLSYDYRLSKFLVSSSGNRCTEQTGKYTVSQKTSHLLIAITFETWDGF